MNQKQWNMVSEINVNKLNEQQITMLRILNNPFPEKYFLKLKEVAVELLVQQLDDAMNNRTVVNGKERKRRVSIVSDKA